MNDFEVLISFGSDDDLFWSVSALAEHEGFTTDEYIKWVLEQHVDNINNEYLHAALEEYF